MSSDTITARAGRAEVEFIHPELRKQIDRLTKGAVSTFLVAAHRQMDPVVADARTDRMLWPRKTGKSQGATTEVERFGPDSVELVALNRVPYTYRLRFSVVTEETIDRESRQVAARTWANMGRYVDRSKDLAGRRRIAHHFIERASGGLITGWWTDRRASEDAIYRMWKGGLNWRHGKGAPNAQVAGKHVWSYRVRLPLKKREAALVAEARGALDRLAGD